MTTERLEVLITDTGGKVVKKNIDDIGKAAVGAQGSVDLLSKAMSGLAAVFGTTQLIRMLDTYTNMQNRLKLVTTGTQNLTAVTNALFEVSAKTRTSFEATTTLYARVALATKNLGIGQKELIGFVQGVNQAVVLSGVGAQEARNAIIQFTQGLAKGRLDGDELRSVLEQIPFVADVIAKKLGVARGELRELGKQGKLTPTVIIEAFQAMDGELTKLFAETLPTFSQAWQVVSDRIMRTLGQLANDSAINQILAQGLALIADNFDVVTAAITGLLPVLALLLGKAALGGLIAALTSIAAFAVANPFTAIFLAVTTGITVFGQLDGEIDKVLKSMNRSVTAVDKLIATWGGARAYLEVLWENFPEWFAGIMERAVNLAIAQWGKLADGLRDMIAGIGKSIDAATPDSLPHFATGIFQGIADQFKSSGELQQQIDFASDYVSRYPDAVKKAGDAASQAYNDILLERSKFIGELTSSSGGGGGGGAAGGLSSKEMARLTPKVTLNDALIDLQRQIELIGIESSERERLVEVLKVEDQIRNSITDREARRKFQLDDGEVQQINDMVAALQRLKDEANVYDEIRKPQLDLQGQMSALNRLFRDQTITLDEYNKKFLELKIQMLEFNTTIEGGVIRGVLKLQQEFSNLGVLAENTLVNGIRSAEDAFVQFTMTGKFQFKDLVNSILADVQRLVVRQSITGPLMQALGAVVGGVFGGIGTSGYQASGAATNGYGLSYANTSFTGVNGGNNVGITGAAFATGGDMTVGGTGGIDSQMVNFRATPGEKVYIRKPGEREPGSGSNVSVKVNVINNNGSNVQVQERQTESGLELDVIIDQLEEAMANNVRRGQGPLLPAMSEKLGVSAKPGNR